MENRKFKVGNTTYTRISKSRALGLYRQGIQVAVAPNLANLASPWINGGFKGKYDPEDSGSPEQQFEIWTNQVSYYNCNGELGRYLAYYEIGEY